MNDQTTIGREKYWDELTDSEKIERLRQEVRMLKINLRDALEAKENFRMHSHSENGEVVIPVNRLSHGPYVGDIVNDKRL